MVKASITVEIADNSLSLSTGLMFRQSLKDNHGMLFVFSSPQVLSFWGRNTYIPLDIAFISPDKKIANIDKVPVMSDRSVYSSVPCKYAIEVSRGYFSDKGISVGDSISIKDGRVFFESV